MLRSDKEWLKQLFSLQAEDKLVPGNTKSSPDVGPALANIGSNSHFVHGYQHIYKLNKISHPITDCLTNNDEGMSHTVHSWLQACHINI